MALIRTPIDRFASLIQFGSCWEWIGQRNNRGYSVFYVGPTAIPRQVLGHRWAYEFFSGQRIPEGMQIDHLCRVRHCVNPDHMEVVTPLINTMRGYSPTRLNAEKTACPAGHEYTPENTWVEKNGYRHCRACKRIRDRHRIRRKGS